MAATERTYVFLVRVRIEGDPDTLPRLAEVGHALTKALTDADLRGDVSVGFSEDQPRLPLDGGAD